jgi:CRISPR system Cascade subunit CasA
LNLFEELWLPIQRTDGSVDWIKPCQISDPDIVAFAANRPDFNGALAQMMIGLLQTTTPVDDEGDWEDLARSPPSADVLKQWFAPVSPAFKLDGDGPRFMQDFDLTAAEGAEMTIDALLIDAAGGSAIDKNTDHFVKRNTINAMCPHCLATALFTLQTNAPAGGAGHRTSLRGGGPLTTLMIATPSKSLWHDLWINVRPQRTFLKQSGNTKKTAPNFTFPWLSSIDSIQTAGGETQPVQVHPHHVFWAMPRRIRVDFTRAFSGACDICKRNSVQLLQHYVTKPQGLNYKGVWRHPFSPYYESKGDWLPVHPQPGGFSYKNWLGWVLGLKQGKKLIEPASVVEYYLRERNRQQDAGQYRISIFGYDMDNMKPRCWYETAFPLFGLAEVDQSLQAKAQSLIGIKIEAAEQCVFYLRIAVKQAWFGDGDVRGDLSYVDKLFWDATEIAFYQQLRLLVEQARLAKDIDLDSPNSTMEPAEHWHKTLKGSALKLFDVDIVGAGNITQQDPRRIADAYNGLRKNLDGDALRAILRLPISERKVSASKVAGKSKPTALPKIKPEEKSN